MITGSSGTTKGTRHLRASSAARTSLIMSVFSNLVSLPLTMMDAELEMMNNGTSNIGGDHDPWGGSKAAPKGLERENKIIQTIMRQLLFALDGLHSTGIVHKGIKPQNVIFSDGSILDPPTFHRRYTT